MYLNIIHHKIHCIVCWCANRRSINTKQRTMNAIYFKDFLKLSHHNVYMLCYAFMAYLSFETYTSRLSNSVPCPDVFTVWYKYMSNSHSSTINCYVK